MKYATITLLTLLCPGASAFCDEPAETARTVSRAAISPEDFSKVYPAVWFNPANGQLAPVTKKSMAPPKVGHFVWLEPRDPEIMFSPSVVVRAAVIGFGDAFFNAERINIGSNEKQVKLSEAEFGRRPVIYVETAAKAFLIQILSVSTEDETMEVRAFEVRNGDRSKGNEARSGDGEAKVAAADSNNTDDVPPLQDRLVGKWAGTADGDNRILITFNADGTFELLNVDPTMPQRVKVRATSTYKCDFSVDPAHLDLDASIHKEKLKEPLKHKFETIIQMIDENSFRMSDLEAAARPKAFGKRTVVLQRQDAVDKKTQKKSVRLLHPFGSLVLYDTAAQEDHMTIAEWKAHVAFSPDGTLLAAGNGAGKTQLWAIPKR